MWPLKSEKDCSEGKVVFGMEWIPYFYLKCWNRLVPTTQNTARMHTSHLCPTSWRRHFCRPCVTSDTGHDLHGAVHSPLQHGFPALLQKCLNRISLVSLSKGWKNTSLVRHLIKFSVGILRYVFFPRWDGCTLYLPFTEMIVRQFHMSGSTCQSASWLDGFPVDGKDQCDPLWGL